MQYESGSSHHGYSPKVAQSPKSSKHGLTVFNGDFFARNYFFEAVITLYII